MSCCGNNGVGRMGAFKQPGAAQVFHNTGPLVNAPMTHAIHHGTHGMGSIFPTTWFGAGEIQWIPGIQNEYVALGIGAVLLLMLMGKR